MARRAQACNLALANGVTYQDLIRRLGAMDVRPDAGNRKRIRLLLAVGRNSDARA